jgi:hypothetical protein
VRFLESFISTAPPSYSSSFRKVVLRLSFELPKVINKQTQTQAQTKTQPQTQAHTSTDRHRDRHSIGDVIRDTAS